MDDLDDIPTQPIPRIVKCIACSFTYVYGRMCRNASCPVHDTRQVYTSRAIDIRPGDVLIGHRTAYVVEHVHPVENGAHAEVLIRVRDSAHETRSFVVRASRVLKRGDRA